MTGHKLQVMPDLFESCKDIAIGDIGKQNFFKKHVNKLTKIKFISKRIE